VTRHGLAQHPPKATALVGLAPLICVAPATRVSSPTLGSTAGIAAPHRPRFDDYTADNTAQMEGLASRRAFPKPLSP
jgi:hypothetical protein